LKKSREIAKQQTIDNKKLEKNNRFLKTIVKITSTVAIVATITLVLLIKL
jgi:type IV secretory pathway component VirB8